MKMLRRLLLIATLVLTLGAGASFVAPSAGATMTNPGSGMGCTSGTDNCGGWVASTADPTCVAYNVNWVHYFIGTSGTLADYHIVVDQWWNGGASCTAGGGAHKIGNVADIYVQDWEVPHVMAANPGYDFGGIWFYGHATTAGFGGSTGVIAWTKCYGNDDSGMAYVASATYGSSNFASGGQGITPAGQSYPGNLTCVVGPTGGMSVNGADVAWAQYYSTISSPSGSFWWTKLLFW